MKLKLAIAVFVGVLMANAQVVNDVGGPNAGNVLAPPPVLAAGWSYDQINAAGPPSVDSPYVYNYPFPTVFRITDDFLPGDVYTVLDFGLPIMATAFGVGAPLPPPPGPGDAPWYNPQYSKATAALLPGPHSLSVTGNGAGGLPAGFWVRLDYVPEPGAYALVAGLGLVAFTAYRRCRK
jgi:hypothetical protein